jgi:hypothetical protein
VDKPLTAEDVAREWGEEFLRELVKELRSPAPTPSVRANPLPPPRDSPTGVSAEEERELVRLWREELDEDMLDALVNSFRPLLEKMAKKISYRHYEVLIEYGILGFRIAASPQRPSKTKKGKLAGFDPASGFRFSTYASRVAHRLMSAAALAMRDDADVFSECLAPRFEDSKQEFDAWAKTPIPTWIERHAAEMEALNHEESCKRWWQIRLKVQAMARAEDCDLGMRIVDYDHFRLWPVPVLGARQDILIEFA